jgi:hypothetical protein
VCCWVAYRQVTVIGVYTSLRAWTHSRGVGTEFRRQTPFRIAEICSCIVERHPCVIEVATWTGFSSNLLVGVET